MSRLLLLVYMYLIIEICAISVQGSTCEDGEVRLSGGRNYREGLVEVCRNKQWGRVCDDQWDENESTVVCRQLGLSEEDVIAFNDANQFQAIDESVSTLPIVLDDLGCNGAESSLLECLPQHNCDGSADGKNENAGVSCLRKGVSLELGPKQLANNTLVTIDNIFEEGDAVLLCSTDRTDCCTNTSNIAGGWYWPNGSLISHVQQITTNNSQTFYVSWDNQTVGINIQNRTVSNGLLVPTGIYHCEMMDKNHMIHHLYVGIYPKNEGNMNITSLWYDRTSQTVVCSSTGGPVTNVRWNKDDMIVVFDGELYEHSKIIINATSATYENRLTMINKSSKATGTYTCHVANLRGNWKESLHLEVCRDMELRYSDESNGGVRNVEVCVNDKWHVAVGEGIMIKSDASQTENNFTVQVSRVHSMTVMVTWSLQSKVDTNWSISRYDVSCTTLLQGGIYEMKIPNVDKNTTTIQVNGLLPSTVYNCCVTAHILINLPVDLISSSCIVTKTVSDLQKTSEYFTIIGLGTGLCVTCLLLLGTSIGLIVTILKHRGEVKLSEVSKDDQTYTEHFVANPIYSDFPEGNGDRLSWDNSDQEESGSRTVSKADLTGCYEDINNLLTRPLHTKQEERDTLPPPPRKNLTPTLSQSLMAADECATGRNRSIDHELNQCVLKNGK